MSCILFVTGLESSCPYENRVEKTKKTVTSQEISIFGTKEENPRCFCFASNHTESGWEHNSPALLCCWFEIFLWCSVYWNFYAIESFAVSSVREECYLGDFFLTLTENNQCLHISLCRRLTFILLFSNIELAVFCTCFSDRINRIRKEGFSFSHLLFSPLSSCLPKKAERIREDCLSASISGNGPFL